MQNKPTAPEGTYGLAIAPWSPREIYAVAANWAEASAPIYTYGADGWLPSGRQVADYAHNPRSALEEELAESIRAGGDAPASAEAMAEALAGDAENI